MSNLEKIAKLKILSIEDNEDGTSTLNFDLDDDFIEWFKDTQGLKRFSHKELRFCYILEATQYKTTIYD